MAGDAQGQLEMEKVKPVPGTCKKEPKGWKVRDE